MLALMTVPGCQPVNGERQSNGRPTTLQVKEAPVADTGRYDRLRTQEADHA